MSLSPTRLGANAPGLPGPTRLPPISAALSRRAALFGAATAAGVSVATCSPAKGAAAGATADARLVAIAAELQAAYDQCEVLSANHGLAEELPEWIALIESFEPLIVELEETPADTLTGALAKARAMQVPTVSDALHGIGDSIALDLVRFGAGALA